MGIDIHSLQLLQYVTRQFGPLGNVATLGRQALHLGPRAMHRWTGRTAASGTLYCEELLKEHFGASAVDSIDNSDYENASIVADLNQSIPDSLNEHYDCVIDFGCTEHIYDVRTAMQNIRAMCKVGGIIVHAVPSAGCCGHGFYQFSPEFFLSYYSEANGFADTSVHLAESIDTKYWYKVNPPAPGQRINLVSRPEVYALVATRKVAATAVKVQQSDYVHSWAEHSARHASRSSAQSPRFAAYVREVIMALPVAGRIYATLDARLSPLGPRSLSRHPALKRIRVKARWN